MLVFSRSILCSDTGGYWKQAGMTWYGVLGSGACGNDKLACMTIDVKVVALSLQG